MSEREGEGTEERNREGKLKKESKTARNIANIAKM